MNDWVVAVPSYRRADMANEQTLAMLANGGVPAERVFVGVAEEEADEYRRVLDPAFYNQLIVHNQPGSQAGARNAMQEALAPGYVVQADDDVRAIERLGDGELVQVDDVAALFDEAFDAMLDVRATLWGVYPVRNHFFMKNRVQTQLCLCVGHLFGQRLDGRTWEHNHLSLKNDYERSLQHFMADGVVARLDYICVHSKVYTGKGGLQGYRTPERTEEAVEQLMARFPGLVKRAKLRDGLQELRLVHPK